VPGGGIEEGETVAETAIREVMEETGIQVEFIREVGVAEDPLGHYVQLKPTHRLPETWEHQREDGPVLCRWVPVTATPELWGRRGDFVHALVRKRVVGYVTRGRELLVFEHAGVLHVPAGRIDHDETLEEGLLREVEEETGVNGLTIVRELADADEVDRLYGVLVHRSWAFHAVAEHGGPDAWEHHVTGTGMDSGMVFPCRWVPLDEPLLLWGKPDPLLDRLRRSIPDT
jgi:8-oxo-dGTP pyrophosphatase MutT (NUDIX family)